MGGRVTEGDQVAAGEDPAAFRALEEFKGERFCAFCGEVVAELVIDAEATSGIERGGTLQRSSLQIIWGECTLEAPIERGAGLVWALRAL